MMRVLVAASLYLDQPTHETIEQGHRAIARARELGDNDAATLASLGVAHALGETDNLAARSLLADALEAAVDSSNDILEGMVLDYLANHMLRAGLRDEVAEMLDERTALGTRRFGLFEPELLYQVARTALEQERFDEAATLVPRRLRLGQARREHRCPVVRALRPRAPGARQGRRRSGTGWVSRVPRSRPPGRSEGTLVELDAMAGICAFRLGRSDIVAEQLDVLSQTQRPLVQAARCLVAGCLAQLNGHPGVADAQFRDAAARFASMRSTTHLRLALEEWARHHENRPFAAHLDEIRDEVRAGRVTTTEAMLAVDALIDGR